MTNSSTPAAGSHGAVQELAGQQADREIAKQWEDAALDGEHGPAGRLAAAGAHGRGGRAASSRRSSDAGVTPDRRCQSLGAPTARHCACITGQFTAGPKAPRRRLRKRRRPQPAVPVCLERRLAWVSEQAAAIALAGFRSLLRAPEAKMMLLTPIIMAVIFGSMLLRRGVDMPEASCGR